jgi:hypothetical protein
LTFQKITAAIGNQSVIKVFMFAERQKKAASFISPEEMEKSENLLNDNYPLTFRIYMLVMLPAFEYIF